MLKYGFTSYSLDKTHCQLNAISMQFKTCPYRLSIHSLLLSGNSERQRVNVMETPSGNLPCASSRYNLRVNHSSLTISGLSIPKSSSAELFVYNMKGRVVGRKLMGQLHTGDDLYRYCTTGFSNRIYYMVVKNLENMCINRKFFVMREYEWVESWKQKLGCRRNKSVLFSINI